MERLPSAESELECTSGTPTHPCGCRGLASPYTASQPVFNGAAVKLAKLRIQEAPRIGYGGSRTACFAVTQSGWQQVDMSLECRILACNSPGWDSSSGVCLCVYGSYRRVVMDRTPLSLKVFPLQAQLKVEETKVT